MMFTSKTPRDLNHDPHPVRIAGRQARSKRMLWSSDVMDPRPEFDHVQHNEPNPILVSIREGYHDIESALALLQDDAREWWTPVVSDAHIDHAHRVLTRLANLSQIGA